MLEINKICAVAWYEAKSLLRWNFFRVYALFLIFFFLINTELLGIKWKYWGIPSCIPYMLSRNFIIVQVVFGTILAVELWMNDLQINSIETIYARSITNTGYITGKVLGVFLVFFMSNIVYMILGFAANIVKFNEASVIPVSYLYYPILLTMPAIVFIVGLSLLITAIVKSKAPAVVLLMGFIICTLFFIGQKLFNVFDFPGLNTPFMYSDFVGFGNIRSLILQRSMYLFFGLCCIFLTVLLLPRLPQSRQTQRISFVLALFFCIGTATAGTQYVKRYYVERASRQHMQDLNKQYVDTPRVSITDCSLDLVHRGDEIEVQAAICFTNKNNIPHDTYVFSLNPGLEVKKSAK